MTKSEAWIPLRERADLARRAFAMHEQGMMVWDIALRLGVSQSNARNLVGYGARLAAGQGEPLEPIRTSTAR